MTLPYGATQIVSALQAKLMESNSGGYTFQSSVEMLILRFVMEQVYLLHIVPNHECHNVFYADRDV